MVRNCSLLLPERKIAITASAVMVNTIYWIIKWKTI
jgi:hypothetical protein